MTDPVTRADFVDGRDGALFRVRSLPVPRDRADPTRAVLIVPPFAEEMNRSRRFLTALRQAIAAHGVQAVLIDPFGTGDSDGDFVDATWEGWHGDISDAVQELHGNGIASVSLVGLRVGCLLADGAARALSRPLERLVYLQPETDGEMPLRRLLRGRVAARRFAGDVAESTEMLWQRLEEGEALELGGYRIAGALATTMRAKRIDLSEPPRTTETSHVFGLVASMHRDGTEEPSVEEPEGTGSQRVSSEFTTTTWQRHELVTRPFWQLQDSTPDHALVERVADALAAP